MECDPLIAIIGTNIALAVTILVATGTIFLWLRGESRADHRALEAKMDENRRETNEIIRGLQEETREIVRNIQSEMRDFHGRLCSIEERHRKSE